MINDALRVIRQYHKLHPVHLAAKLHLTSEYLLALESGKEQPTVPVLQRYAAHFGIPLASLLIFSEQLSGKTPAHVAQRFVAKKMLKILDWVADEKNACAPA